MRRRFEPVDDPLVPDPVVLYRATVLPPWMHPNEDGLVEIHVTIGRTGRLAIHCWFGSSVNDTWTKRYPEGDLTSHREDLARLPSIVTIEEMERRGFRCE